MGEQLLENRDVNDRLEQLLNRQVDLIAKLQTKVEEVLSWDTSVDSADATAAYFQALESAADSLESLSEAYQYYEDFDSEVVGEDEEADRK